MESIKVYNIASAQGFLSSKYSANTKLLIHAGEADTTAGTDIIDSASGHTITAVANAQVDTAYSRMGTGSVMFDGTGDGLSLDDHADWNLGTGAFTIHMHTRFGAIGGVTRTLFSQYVDVNNYVQLSYSGTGFNFYIKASEVFLLSMYAPATITEGQWYHVAVIRGWGGVASSFAITLEGRSIKTATADITSPDLAAVMQIGLVAAANSMIGHIDEFTWVKGEAVWVADFTPPTFLST